MLYEIVLIYFIVSNKEYVVLFKLICMFELICLSRILQNKLWKLWFLSKHVWFIIDILSYGWNLTLTLILKSIICWEMINLKDLKRETTNWSRIAIDNYADVFVSIKIEKSLSREECVCFSSCCLYVLLYINALDEFNS